MFFIDFLCISSLFLIIFSRLVVPNYSASNYEEFKTNCIACFINCYGKQGFVLTLIKNNKIPRQNN